MASSKSKTSSTPFQLVNLEEIKKASVVLKTLNHKTRQDILNLLDSNNRIKVKEVCKKLEGDRSVISDYMGMLKRAGAVTAKEEGPAVYYSVDHKRLAEVEAGVKLING